MIKRLASVVAFWLLADARRRIQQLATSIDVLDREIEVLLNSRFEREVGR